MNETWQFKPRIKAFKLTVAWCLDAALEQVLPAGTLVDFDEYAASGTLPENRREENHRMLFFDTVLRLDNPSASVPQTAAIRMEMDTFRNETEITGVQIICTGWVEYRPAVGKTSRWVFTCKLEPGAAELTDNKFESD
ncbi:MAG: hypothetical protein HY918_02585 [Candidatus Doudnabacteria bacterium]|nr:hypothetical protein [Candidatus Doudnabacteria bacterium]